MKWDKFYLVTTSVDDQRWYKVLKDFSENASEIKGENVIEFITDINDAPSVEDLDGSINNLVAYNDVMIDNKKNSARIFSRGWHKNTDVIYITQRNTQIPKLIRDN